MIFTSEPLGEITNHGKYGGDVAVTTSPGAIFELHSKPHVCEWWDGVCLDLQTKYHEAGKKKDGKGANKNTRERVYVFVILPALASYKILRARLSLAFSYLCPPIKDLHTSIAICQSVCTHLQSSG